MAPMLKVAAVQQIAVQRTILDAGPQKHPLERRIAAGVVAGLVVARATDVPCLSFACARNFSIVEPASSARPYAKNRITATPARAIRTHRRRLTSRTLNLQIFGGALAASSGSTRGAHDLKRLCEGRCPCLRKPKRAPRGPPDKLTEIETSDQAEADPLFSSSRSA